MSVPVRTLNSSAARCGLLPAPELAKLSCPGFAFAAATSSATLRIGLSARTTSAFITRATTAIGVRSLRES